MIKIAETHEEKRENILHWERMRMTAQKIRDAYDRASEDAYHKKFIIKLKLSKRPDFMEPVYVLKMSFW